ncbi:NSP-INTERACTING KINASE 3 [Olea europaea subsp. europaea]|uniref:non-specific serine/threonine protein kinase n=1 Tax=Olea europaea subsp. europaea TaxID=158383 RepID=A0A8S0UV75_OLEEU|nr:NSP-INTERACTING KINASE 3 [Olea europaea subsp. europaea]
MERNKSLLWKVGLIVLTLMNGSYSTLSPSGINYEVVALMAIKSDLHDPYEVLENWDANSVDPCSWRMVTCSPDGYVSALGLPNLSLSGKLSAGVGNLTNLQSLLKSLKNSNQSQSQLLILTTRFMGPTIFINFLTTHFINFYENLLKLIFSYTNRGLRDTFICELGHQYDPEVCLGHLRRYTFKELRAATKHFNPKNLLGKGGFGIVYKGSLNDGTVVAVKRLKDYNAVGGEIQFQTEVETISLAVHRNLLRLWGFCSTKNERLLVYPYMPNGSVASRLKDHIHGRPVLDWSRRRRIALGTARGIVYLHEQCDPKIIHRDVKAANILLDEDFEAVVGDFGLAKLLDHQDSHVTTAVRGTVGHIAPEYLSTGQSSEKTDVFGFGILLLELITGQKAVDFGPGTNQKGIILDWVKKLHKDGKLNLMVDKDLKKNFDKVELEEIVQVALLCTHFNPIHRPKMSEVLRMLEGDGLVEKWESSQTVDTPRYHTFENPSQRYSDFIEESSLVVEAMELSGPR